MNGNRATWTRRVLTVGVAALVLYVVWVIWDHDAVMRWIEDAPVLPFFVAMAFLPALGVPHTPFFLLAGATYDAKLALLGTTVALAVNLALCYWIGRSGLRSQLVRILARFGYELPDLDVGDGEQSTLRTARLTAMIKLTPVVPGFIKNYALGAARVPFWIYFAVAMAVSGVYAAGLIMLGDSLLDHEFQRGVAALLVAGVIGFVAWRWIRRPRTGHEHQPHAA